MQLDSDKVLYSTLTGSVSGQAKIHNVRSPLISKGDKVGEVEAVTMSSFLADPAQYGTFLIPHFDVGPDLCFFIEHEPNLVPVFVQLKLSKRVSRVNAVATTDPEKFYSCKNKKRPKKYISEHKRCMEILKARYNGFHIGILIVYPQEWKSELFSETYKAGLVRFERVFDGRNQDGIFDEAHLQYLAKIGIE